MSESNELRELQRRAYGRDAALTRVEAARLRELQGRRAPAYSETTAAPGGGREDHAAPAPARDSPPGEVEPTDPLEQLLAADRATESEETAPEQRSGSRAVLRRHWRTVVVASTLLLVAGFGAGWAMFAPHSDDVPLMSSEQERRSELERERDFDIGTVRAVGRDDERDALVWWGTKDDGALTCVVIDVQGQTESQCQRTEDFENVGVNVSVMLPGGTEENGVFEYASVNAYVLLSASGEPMVSISQWDSSTSISAQFAGEERDRAEELVAQGFEMNLSIVGYFRDEPVWMGNRYGETVEPETCLIVDGADADVACLPTLVAIENDLTVRVVDEGTSPKRDVELTLAFTATQTPYLVIGQG